MGDAVYRSSIWRQRRRARQCGIKPICSAREGNGIKFMSSDAFIDNLGAGAWRFNAEVGRPEAARPVRRNQRYCAIVRPTILAGQK